MGLLIFAANLRFGKMIGPVLGGMILLYDLLVINTFGISYYKTSPLSMSRLSLVDPKGITAYPNMTYAFIFYGIGIAICSVFIVISVKKQTVENSLVL